MTIDAELFLEIEPHGIDAECAPTRGSGKNIPVLLKVRPAHELRRYNRHNMYDRRFRVDSCGQVRLDLSIFIHFRQIGGNSLL